MSVDLDVTGVVVGGSNICQKFLLEHEQTNCQRPSVPKNWVLKLKEQLREEFKIMASHSHIQSHLNSLIWMLDEWKTPFVTLKLKFLCKNMDIHVILPSMKKLPSTRGALLRGLKSKQASCFHDLYRSRSNCSEEAVFLNLVYLHLASTCKHCFLFSFLLFEILRNSKKKTPCTLYSCVYEN